MLRALRRWSPTLAIAAGIAYFGGHALTGQSGLLAWSGYQHRIAELETSLDETVAVRTDLEDRAMRLRDETLDLDYVEERARALLGMGHPRDIVVPAAARR
ncbi:MAG: septum formation initiator family protein [Maricaulaceae bacterium]|jgi:cell division protein FtsB